MRQKINKLENEFRESMGLKNFDIYKAPEEIEALLKKPELQNEIDEMKEF